MKQLLCKTKAYKLHHYEDEEGNVRHKQYSHVIYALNCQRLDKGYDFCQILGYVNYKGQFEVSEDLKSEYSEVSRYNIDVNARTANDIITILQAYANGNKGHSAINTITFDYNSDYNLYECSGNFKFKDNEEFTHEDLNILAKSEDEAKEKIYRYYLVDEKQPLEINILN